jgi:type IX secretion system PorP/SprF family membrane protein
MKQFFPLLIFLLLCNTTSLHAQDPQYSQYFSSPIALNPAFTGYYDGVHRLSTNFRNQWLGAGDPFTTATISFDTRLAATKLNNNILGVGLMVTGDRTATGTYNSNYASLSTAYHQALDEEGYQHLAIGFQGNMGTRTLDYNRISFNDQLTSRGFDLSLPNNENFITQKAIYYDVNVGVMYNYLKDRNRHFLGASFYHVNQPKMSFLGNDAYTLPTRLTVHGGSSLLVNAQGELFLSANYIKQGNISSATLGIAYGYSIEERNDENVLYAGLFYRHKDAVYPYIGYLFNDLQIGVSYDVNVTGVQTGNKRNRSFELSIIYHFFDPNVTRRVMPWH